MTRQIEISCLSFQERALFGDCRVAKACSEETKAKCLTFDRQASAQAWLRKREAVLDAPGAVLATLPSGDTHGSAIDRYMDARLDKIDTARTPVNLLAGVYDLTCTPEDAKRTAAAIAGTVAPGS